MAVDLIGCGFTTVSFDLDQQADPALHVDQIARFMEVWKGRAVAIGNVDATPFGRATKAEIEAEVRRCVDAAGRYSGWILSTSCEIPPRSNPEVVQWFMDGEGLRPLRALPGIDIFRSHDCPRNEARYARTGPI